MLAATGGSLTWAPGVSAGTGRGQRHRRVIVLAFDGLDPRIVDTLMQQGRLPNMKHVAEMGGYKRMATSTPAITPIAFSNIIGGTDPRTHGIFDFIHRNIIDGGSGIMADFALCSTHDPKGWLADNSPAIGQWKLPLAAGTVELNRRGISFWDPLLRKGNDVSVYHLPGTYPPPEPEGKGRFRCLSGMGTPDVFGGYGDFTSFESDRITAETVGGGRFVPLRPTEEKYTDGEVTRVKIHAHRFASKLEGPENYLHRGEAKKKLAGGVKRDEDGNVLREDPKHLTLPVVFTRDPEADVVKIEFAGQTLVHNQGEWTDWIQFEFDTDIPAGAVLGAMQLPTKMPAILRFYVKQVHPNLKIYTTPMNFDPTRPVNPISTPQDHAAEIAEEDGPYYTTGIPEDNKAVREGALSEADFISQCDLVWDEKFVQTHRHLDQFESGCLFNYVGATDMMQHIFWRDRDPDHPGRLAEQGDIYAETINHQYERADQMVGDVLEKMREEDVLMIISDHGFTTFRKGLNVNTWLLDNDYLRLAAPSVRSGKELLYKGKISWDRTRAYAIGLNAMYLNMAGREKFGTVKPSERRALMEEIAQKMLEIEDNGQRVIERIDFVDKLYPEAMKDEKHGGFRMLAPDFFIGYAEGYRVSWDTSLGGVPREQMEINTDRWSGTHCIAPNLTPGIFISNQPIMRDDLKVSDVAATIVAAFDLPVPNEMIGNDVFSDAD